MSEENKTVETKVTTETEEGVKAEGENILSDIVDEDNSEEVPEEKVETRGRKPINGVQDVFDKLIKDEKFFAEEKHLSNFLKLYQMN